MESGTTSTTIERARSRLRSPRQVAGKAVYQDSTKHKSFSGKLNSLVLAGMLPLHTTYLLKVVRCPSSKMSTILEMRRDTWSPEF